MEVTEFNLKFDTKWAWVDLTVNQNIGSDLTILTVGDSWTWGDELGLACGIKGPDQNSDSEYRISKCFGNLLANKLNANWVQIALPSGSNEWIVSEAEKLCLQLAKQTKQLIVIINFSDHCREINNEYSSVSAFYQELFEQRLPILNALKLVEQTYYSQIRKLAGHENVSVIANSTFTEPLEKYRLPRFHQLEKTWLELLVDELKQPCYLHTTGAWELDKFLTNNDLMTDEYKREIESQYFPAMEQRTRDMQRSPFLLKRCHPNEQGHEIWANYLYNYVKNSL